MRDKEQVFCLICSMKELLISQNATRYIRMLSFRIRRKPATHNNVIVLIVRLNRNRIRYQFLSKMSNMHTTTVVQNARDVKSSQQPDKVAGERSQRFIVKR